MDSSYAEALARLQQEEHAAKEAAEQLGFKFAKDTEALLRQAAEEARRNMDSAGIVLFLLIVFLLLRLIQILLMVFLLNYLFLLLHSHILPSHPQALMSHMADSQAPQILVIINKVLAFSVLLLMMMTLPKL